MATRNARGRGRQNEQKRRPGSTETDLYRPSAEPGTNPMIVLRISEVHLVGRIDHQHIVELRWHNEMTGQEGTSTREAMVDLLAGSEVVRAIVVDDLGDVEVRVVDADPPYLQTFADDRATDNLLWLPKY
jgi:hypothetical protein